MSGGVQMWMAMLLACQGPRGLCGEGTTKEDGACIPEDGSVLCGPGTVERDGVCEADESVAGGPMALMLPFPEGAQAVVSQGFHGDFSHAGWQTWAVDFPAAEGTPIAAVRAGVVVATREDSSTGCGDSSCADLANFIRIDHGDGTFAEYLHLELEGVDVLVGETVGRGQPLGRSGNTGWSTGPHLHLIVIDSAGFSVPIAFTEFEQTAGSGSPYSGGQAVSQNAEQAPPDSIEPSGCPPDTFGYRGVRLVSEFPCSLATYGQDYPLVADVEPGFDLVVHRYSNVEGAYRTRCFPSTDGRVSETLRFNQAVFDGSTYMTLTAIPEAQECQVFWGWETSPRIFLRP